MKILVRMDYFIKGVSYVTSASYLAMSRTLKKISMVIETNVWYRVGLQVAVSKTTGENVL